jgi:hydrogenase/urease accessory protein HupE
VILRWKRHTEAMQYEGFSESSGRLVLEERPMRLLLPPLAAALAATAFAAAHPNSVSSSRVVVDGGAVRLELRCQAATLLEASPLDRDGDGRLSADELADGLPELERRILLGYRVSAPSAGEIWIPLEGKLVEGHVVAPGEQVDFLFRFQAPEKLDGLRIEFSLFRESNPWHRDQAQIVWNGGAPRSRLLWIEDPIWVSRASASEGGSFLQYVGMGFEHILTGYDHIAFLVALVVAARRLRALLGVVTAFTVAHSITLALASLDVVRLPSGPVEAVIALSIAWVGLRTAIDPTPRRLWPEAFGFGLVHGLGFARILAESLATESQKLGGLVGFNLGIEVGQLAIVAASALVLALVRIPRAAPRGEGLAPPVVRRPVSVAVGVLGLYWLLARTLAG